MLKYPVFKPHLRVEIVPGEGAFVLSLDGARQTVLRGRLYERVLPWVGGGRSADEVCDQLQNEVAAAEVYYVLTQLERKGYLCEETESLPPGEAALWSAQQVDPGEAARRLAETAVSVQSFGVDAGPFSTLLQDLRVRVEEGGKLGVVLSDSYLREQLKEHNAAALRDERPWLLVRPVGRQLWVGPLFRPGVTGCWECLAHRLRANCPVESYLESRSGRAGTAADPACSPATLQVAFGLAANAVATWVACGDLPALEGKIQTFDVTSWQAQGHTLVRLPFCPACGVREAGSNGAIQPVSLNRQLKRFVRDGGHRVVAPEVTLERYGYHVSPITGAVSMLERMGPASEGAMHVYLAGQNLARRHRNLEHLRGDLRNMSSGKGATDLQAKASGLCEGLERHSGAFRGDEPRRRGRLADLGGAAIFLPDCLLFSDRQYAERDAWNARKSHYNFVPARYDLEAEIDWTPVWSLSRRESRYLPTAFCYFNVPHGDGPPFCLACSNGNAAGNTLEEAILQGFLELIERDSVALWWYNRVRRPGVDLDSFADPHLDHFRHYLRERGRTLWALDLTTDFNVPVFAAMSRATEGAEERIVLGFGAHLDPHIALMRAVTEMNQLMGHLPSEPNRGEIEEKLSDTETLQWLRTATVANQPYLLADERTPLRVASSYSGACTDDVAEDVRALQALVERQGMEVLVLDQTRAEIGLPVVKVIVPGLRHFWARFAPGRLYDVPVRLGWLPRPLAEDELNPIPMFL